MKVVTSSIAGTGLFALDVILSPDGDVEKYALGGSAGNVLTILAALGWAAAPITTVGDDSAADLLEDELAEVGADLRFVRRSRDRATPVVFQHQLRPRSPTTHIFSFDCPTCGARRTPQWDDPAFSALDQPLPRAGFFFLDRPTELGITLAQHFSEKGAIVVFEPSSIGRSPALFAAAVRVAHIVKYAADRIRDLGHFPSPAMMVEIQTLGSEGLRYRRPQTSNTWTTLEAYKLGNLTDTAGAGDWCTAGLLYELHRQRQHISALHAISDDSLERALIFGQALSALNCLAQGARGILDAFSAEETLVLAEKLSSLALSDEAIEQDDTLARVGALVAASSKRSRDRTFDCCPAF